MTRHLTTPDYWTDHWQAVELPYLVDMRSYHWYSLARLFNRVVPTGPLATLEVGSGACQWLIYFAQTFGHEVWGIDNAPGACRIGRENLELASVNGTVVCEDLFSSPFPTRQFDVVLSVGVVEHFDDFRAALREMHRLVAPGGILITIVPNFVGWMGFMKRRFEPEVYRLHQVVTAGDLRAAYRELGLGGVEVGHTGSFRVPYRSHSRGTGWQRYALRAGRLLDAGLTTAYRVLGRGPEGAWISALTYAVGHRESSADATKQA